MQILEVERSESGLAEAREMGTAVDLPHHYGEYAVFAEFLRDTVTRRPC